MVFGLYIPVVKSIRTKLRIKSRPDLCDGSYPTYCTQAPRYFNITAIIVQAAKTELLDDMKKYWLPNRGTTENFWEHEWNKHGTCVNTLAPSCYGDGYEPGDEVVDFMGKAMEVFKVCSINLI
jgi:ribonuclease T2